MAPALHGDLCIGLPNTVSLMPVPPGGSFSEETEKKFEHFSGLINNQVSRR